MVSFVIDYSWKFVFRHYGLLMLEMRPRHFQQLVQRRNNLPSITKGERLIDHAENKFNLLRNNINPPGEIRLFISD